MKSTNGRSGSTNCSRDGEGGGTVIFGRRMSLTWTLARAAPSPPRGEGGGGGGATSPPPPPPRGGEGGGGGGFRPHGPSPLTPPSPRWGEGGASGETVACDCGRRIY